MIYIDYRIVSVNIALRNFLDQDLIKKSLEHPSINGEIVAGFGGGSASFLIVFITIYLFSMREIRNTSQGS